MYVYIHSLTYDWKPISLTRSEELSLFLRFLNGAYIIIYIPCSKKKTLVYSKASTNTQVVDTRGKCVVCTSYV